MESENIQPPVARHIMYHKVYCVVATFQICGSKWSALSISEGHFTHICTLQSSLIRYLRMPKKLVSIDESWHSHGHCALLNYISVYDNTSIRNIFPVTLLGCNSFSFQKAICSLLEGLEKYHQYYFPVLRCLHAVTSKLARHPLGKQVCALCLVVLPSVEPTWQPA